MVRKSSLFAFCLLIALSVTSCKLPGPDVDTLERITDSWPAYFYGGDNRVVQRYVRHMVALANGDVLLQGSDTAGETFFGLDRPFLMRVDHNGAPVWWLQSRDLGWVESLRETASGDIQVVSSSGDVRVQTFSYDGQPLETRLFSNTQNINHRSEIACEDGGIAIGGSHRDSYGGFMLHFYYSDTLSIVRLNADDTLAWTRHFTNPTWDRVIFRHFAECNGDFLIAGNADIGDDIDGQSHGFLARVDANGDILWTATTERLSYPGAIAGTADGGAACIVWGEQSDELVRLDGDGQQLWSQTLPNGWRGGENALFENALGELLLWNRPSMHGMVASVTRFSLEGVPAWDYQLESYLDGQAMDLTPAGGCAIAGSYTFNVEGPYSFLAPATPLFVLPVQE